MSCSTKSRSALVIFEGLFILMALRMEARSAEDAALPDDLLDEAAIAIPITDTGDTGDTANEEAAP